MEHEREALKASLLSIYQGGAGDHARTSRRTGATQFNDAGTFWRETLRLGLRLLVISCVQFHNV